MFYYFISGLWVGYGIMIIWIYHDQQNPPNEFFIWLYLTAIIFFWQTIRINKKRSWRK